VTLRRKTSARRRTGRSQKRDSAAARLSRPRRMHRSSSHRTDRAWAHLDGVRLRRAMQTPAARLAIAGLCFLALVVGSFSSTSVVRYLQGNAASASPVLLRTISVQGNERLSPQQVAAAAGVAKDCVAASIDTATVEARLLEHPWIRRADAIAMPNGKLLIRVLEREPLAVLFGPGSGRNAERPRLVDTTGMPFVEVEPSRWGDLPRLHSKGLLATGRSNSTLITAVELAHSVSRSRIGTARSSEIQLPAEDSSEGWVLRRNPGKRRVILGERDLGPRLQRLALLLASDLGSARGAAEIDLRFADRAVMRSESSSR